MQDEIGRDVLLRQIEERFGAGGTFFAEELVRQLDRVHAWAEGLLVEVCSPQGQFIIGDDPAHPMDDTATFGLLAGVTIDRAATIAMPISPRYAVGLSREFRYAELDADATRNMNRTPWVAGSASVRDDNPHPEGEAIVADFNENEVCRIARLPPERDAVAPPRDLDAGQRNRRRRPGGSFGPRQAPGPRRMASEQRRLSNPF